MKNYFSFLFLSLIFALFVSFSITSCQKNPCKNSDCGVHAVCNGLNGECVCLDGYTKDASGKCVKPPYISPCDTMSCGYGTCDSATVSCVCDLGYEKDANGKCTIEARDKYIGTYTVTEQGLGAASGAYTVTMSKGPTNIWWIILTGHGGYSCGVTNEPVILQGSLSLGGSSPGLNFNEFSRYCGSLEYSYSRIDGIQIIGNTFSANYEVRESLSGVKVRDVTATFVKQ